MKTKVKFYLHHLPTLWLLHLPHLCNEALPQYFNLVTEKTTYIPLITGENPNHSRVQIHSWRTDTPRAAGTAVSSKMKPNPNWFLVYENPGVNPLSRQYGQVTAETGYKGWAQQPARIMELLTRKDGKVYWAVLEFWKEDGAVGTLALANSNQPWEAPVPGTQNAEIQLEVSSTWKLRSLSPLPKQLYFHSQIEVIDKRKIILFIIFFIIPLFYFSFNFVYFP